MTEQEVLERERRIQSELVGPGNLAALWELTAEIGRLRGLIEQAEWEGGDGHPQEVDACCPWCRRYAENGHHHDCPAFGSGA